MATCPECKSPKLIKFGMKKLRSGVYQQYQCQRCRRIFRSHRKMTEKK